MDILLIVPLLDVVEDAGVYFNNCLDYNLSIYCPEAVNM